MDMSIRFPNLQVIFGYIPKSFQVFGYEVTVYGVLLAAALLLALAVIVTEAKRKNQNQDIYLGASVLAMLLGIVGARLWYVGLHWKLYRANPAEILDITGGGFSFWGALLGGCLALALVAAVKKQNFGELADTVSIGLVSGQIIAVWGNFFSREAFGEYTSSIFAMDLPVTAVRSADVTALMRENLLDVGGVSYIRVHPLFLYESFWCAVLLLFLLSYKRRKRFSGEVFMTYLAGYGLGRFFISWLRTDELRILGTGIAVSQIISASLFVGFGLIVIIRRSMAKKRADMRRRRREKVYEEEERMEAELARADAENEAKNSGVEIVKTPEEIGPEHRQQEGSAEEPEAESEAGSDDESVPDTAAVNETDEQEQ